MGIVQSCKANQEDDNPADPALMEDYLSLENNIMREEAEAPGPALSHALVRQELLQTQVEIAEERMQKFQRTGGSDESLREVMEQLNVDRNEKVAMEHEEFIANINRQALALNELTMLSQRAHAAEEETKILSAKVTYLQSLYQQQDILLSNVFDDAYGDDDEVQLERDLDKLRSYRDTLSGGALEWHEAATNVQNATELLERAVQCWKMLDSQTAETRFHLATEARNGIQEAALAVQTAQDLLSGVQFPYCTTREVSAVLQAIVYIFTDIQIPDRFEHAGRCYINFHQRAIALAEWMNQTIDQSLKKDLEDVDSQVKELTLRLRNMRVALIRHRMGDGSEVSVRSTSSRNNNVTPYPGESRIRSQPYGYDSRGFKELDHSALFPANSQVTQLNKGKNNLVVKEFKKNLANRSHLWSSRRVEEMQMHFLKEPHTPQNNNHNHNGSSHNRQPQQQQIRY